MRKLYLLLLSTSLFYPTVIMANTTDDVHKAHKNHKFHKIHAAHRYYKGQVSLATVPVVQSNNSSNLKFTGYVDGSYNYLSRNKFTGGSYDRVYDQAPNGLTLQQTAITLAYQPSQGFGGLLNLIAGRDVNGVAPYGFKPVSEFDSQTIAVDFTQAYLQYVRGPVTIIGGRFTTLVGVEQVDPTQNANFSRSILFYNTPDTHAGLRGTYAVNDKLNLILGVNDGWDNIRDLGRRKTVEFGMSYILNPVFSFSVQGYNGEERATSQTSFGSTGIRTLIDLIATLNATEKLTFIANYDYGWQTKAALPTGVLTKATWSGITGYGNYKFNDKWRTSIRAEVFDDQDGFRTGVRQNWRELTLTIGYIPLKNLEIRAEVRHDFSNVNSFVSSTGVSVSNNNQSYALEGVYKFEGAF